MRDPRQLLRRVGALDARAILAAALAAAFLAAASPAAAATVTVNTTTDSGTTGDCPSFCELRDALHQANPGDTVVIPAGHYVLDPSFGVISIFNGLTLVGDGARTTVIDGNGDGILNFTLPGGDTLSITGLSLVNSRERSAIEVTGGILQLTAVTIANNNNDGGSSNGKGGGVYAHDMDGFFIDRCTFSSNAAASGGGIYAENLNGAIITDSTFFGNSAATGGSAIQAVNIPGFGGVQLIGVTLTANTSSPAFAVDLAAIGVGVANTIIAGNPGGGCSITNSRFFSVNDLDGDGSCAFTDPGSLTGDPHLGPLANNGGPTDTVALLAGSPAIDAGNDGACSAFTPTDQRGVSRPQGPHCDMGAYEVQVPPPNCAGAVASPNLLWPANNKMVPIHINGVTDPSGGAVTLTVTSIFQDEPVAGSPDGTGVGTSSPAVRAERDGGGDGRVYHISFTATNSAGGSCTGSVTVGVPHDQGRHSTPVDGGSLYDSTVP